MKIWKFFRHKSLVLLCTLKKKKKSNQEISSGEMASMQIGLFCIRKCIDILVENSEKAMI